MSDNLNTHWIERLLSYRLAPLKSFWQENRACSEIFINQDNDIWIDNNLRLEKLPLFLNQGDTEAVVRLFLNQSQQTGSILESSWGPWRLSGALSHITHKGSFLCLRKHHTHHAYPSLSQSFIPSTRKEPITPNSLEATLKAITESHSNILICGPTSSGKTSVLSSLIHLMPMTFRFFLLEDTPEIQISQPHWIGLHRPSHQWPELIKFILRCRPDCIAIGEVRDQAAWNLVNLLDSGHQCCLITIHAKNPYSAIKRFSWLLKQSPHANSLSLKELEIQTARLFSFIIQCQRDSHHRGIQSIAKTEFDDHSWGLQYYEFC